MSSDTLVPEMDGAVGEGITGVNTAEEGTGPMVRDPNFNPCFIYTESVNPMFDPRRVLLRRTFFINEDCSKYLSVGYYPARDYLPLVEVDASNECLFVSRRNTCGHSRNICREL
jgi:hypothetical protein